MLLCLRTRLVPWMASGLLLGLLVGGPGLFGIRDLFRFREDDFGLVGTPRNAFVSARLISPYTTLCACVVREP